MTKIQLTVFVLLLSAGAIAQDSTGTSSMDEVIVTANKYPKKQSETGKVITVIGRQQLERSGGRSVPELLNTVAGITVIGANNNLGTNQTVSIRGGSAGNALILIDGIPVNDPSVITNYFDLNFFPVEQIERIEILKGGQSTLYGSDAVAGVINIITRKSTRAGIEGNASVVAGSYNTFGADAGVRGSSGKSGYSLQYGYLRSEGFSAANDSTGRENFDRDGFNRHSLTGSWRTNLGSSLQLNLFGQFSHYKTDLDISAFTDERDYSATNVNAFGGAGLTYQLSRGSLQFNYRYNHVRRSYLDDSSYKSSPFVTYSESEFTGKTHFAELYGNWRWKKAELLAGADYRRNATQQQSVYIYSSGGSISSLSDTLAHMSQVSPFLSIFLKPVRGLNVEIGGRWNHHSVYGNNFTYNFNPSVLVEKKLKLFANLYSAFKTPTLYQLFDQMAGNRGLQAERSTILEAGFQIFASNNLTLRALHFNRTTRDAIQYIITNPATFAAQYRNVSRQRNHGIETEIEYRSDKWNMAANYTYTSGSIRSPYDATGIEQPKDTIYNNIYRIPRNTFNFTGGVNVTKQLYLSTILRLVDERLEPVYARAPRTMDGYYTLDFYGEYTFAKKFKVFADFKNVTDQQYFDILGYNTRGFNFMAGVRVRF